MNPNTIPSYSHRSSEFKALYAELQKRLLVCAGLNPETDTVIVLTGSGTLANEVVIYSSYGVNVPESGGMFAGRIEAMANLHHRKNLMSPLFGVLYETGISKLNDPSYWNFADCISAWPYYDIPRGVDVATCVNSKQLGAPCGLSFIFIRNLRINIQNYFRPPQHTYLSLARYVEYAENHQTPNTPAISLIEQTLLALPFNVESLRKKIDARRAFLTEAADKYGVGHTGEGPVLTFTKKLNTSIDLYGNSGTSQVFLWSGTDSQYECLAKDLSCA